MTEMKPLPVRLIIWCELQAIVFIFQKLVPTAFSSYSEVRMSLRRMATEHWDQMEAWRK